VIITEFLVDKNDVYCSAMSVHGWYNAYITDAVRYNRPTSC